MSSVPGHRRNEDGSPFTKIPAGQHPGVVPIIPPAPLEGDDFQVNIVSTDRDLQNTLNKKPEPKQAPAEPILDEMEFPIPSPEPLPLQERARIEIPGDYEEDDEQPKHDDILDLAGVPQPGTLEEEIQAAISRGIYRATKLSKFVTETITNSDKVLDEKLRDALDDWLIDSIRAKGAATTSIRDIGAAITENGAKIVMNLEATEKIIFDLVELRQQKKLIKLFDLGEYESEILLGGIDKDFGRARDLERERQRARVKDIGQKQQFLDAINAVKKAIDELNVSVDSAQSTTSPFVKPGWNHAQRKHDGEDPEN